ncbi:MAG: TonB-dependent receptor [Bacteroidales bacterium]|nr:TonB-dependent receptor [Bacteroidales bacterium]
MMRKIIFLLIIISFSGIFAFSQNCDWAAINDANQKYEDGNFDLALNMAQNCFSSNIDDNQRIEVLRLMSKTYLATDQDSAAITMAKKILEINPRFQPYYLTDPPKFIDIIQGLKKLNQQNVVVSISKKEENVNLAPATAVTFSEEQIKQRGYNDFEAVLHDLPGFDISRSNGNLYTHVYQRGYRSINTNRTLFLIDGVEDNDLWSSNVYLSRQLIMSNLKSVEVVYGPASTMYGSNAFLGVINIISKDPQDIIEPNKSFGTSIRAGYGSYNTKFIDGTFALQTKDHNIGFSFSGRTFFSDEQNLSNYSDHDYSSRELTDEMSQEYHSILDITDSIQVAAFLANNPSSGDLYYLDANNHLLLTDQGVNKAFANDNYSLNNVVFSDKTETMALNAKFKIYDFTLGWYFWKKAEGPGSQYNDIAYLGFNEGQSWRPIHHFFYVKYEKDINTKLNVSNFLRYKIHYMSKNNRIVTFSDNYLSGELSMTDLLNGVVPMWDSVYLFYKANQVRNETKISYQVNSKISLLAGLEARFSSIQGDYYLAFENDAEQSGFALTDIPGGNQFFSKDIGFYLQSGISILPNLNLTLGGRYDYNLVRLDEGYGNVFNERIALVYSPKTFIFKGIYATAFKDATNREKYSTAPGKRELPNPDLQPEKVQNIEVSIGKQLFNNGIVSVAFYNSMYSNIIQEVKVSLEDGSETGQNQALGEAQIYGVNAFASWSVKKINFYANYTFTEPYAIDPKDSDGNLFLDSLGNEIHRLRIGDIAMHRANFGFNYLFKDVLDFDLRANFVGERITGSNTTVSTNHDIFTPYFLLNSTISYSPKNTGITIQLTAFNLLNTEYFEPGLDQATGALASSLAQNRRNIYLSLFYNF